MQHRCTVSSDVLDKGSAYEVTFAVVVGFSLPSDGTVTRVKPGNQKLNTFQKTSYQTLKLKSLAARIFLRRGCRITTAYTRANICKCAKDKQCYFSPRGGHCLLVSLLADW